MDSVRIEFNQQAEDEGRSGSHLRPTLNDASLTTEPADHFCCTKRGALAAEISRASRRGRHTFISGFFSNFVHFEALGHASFVGRTAARPCSRTRKHFQLAPLEPARCGNRRRFGRDVFACWRLFGVHSVHCSTLSRFCHPNLLIGVISISHIISRFGRVSG